MQPKTSGRRYDTKLHINIESELKALIDKHAKESFMQQAEYVRHAIRNQIRNDIKLRGDVSNDDA